MEKRDIPSIEELQKDIRGNLLLDSFVPETLKLVSERNHLVYRIQERERYGGKWWCLRAINPISYRRNEWITIEEEERLMHLLPGRALSPATWDGTFPICDIRFLIQEFVSDVVCFNDLKPLSHEHIAAAAKAIALLNEQKITPENFQFREEHMKETYSSSWRVWIFRLLDAIRRRPSRDTLSWIREIIPVAWRARAILQQYDRLLNGRTGTFHFDGAHCGNTYLRQDGTVTFLDWQRVSFRRDPAFTAARFLVSIHEDGSISRTEVNTFINAYLGDRQFYGFKYFLRARILERLVSDLVYVVWDAARRGVKEPLESATNVAKRREVVLTRIASMKDKNHL